MSEIGPNQRMGSKPAATNSKRKEKEEERDLAPLVQTEYSERHFVCSNAFFYTT